MCQNHSFLQQLPARLPICPKVRNSAAKGTPEIGWNWLFISVGLSMPFALDSLGLCVSRMPWQQRIHLDIGTGGRWTAWKPCHRQCEADAQGIHHFAVVTHCHQQSPGIRRICGKTNGPTQICHMEANGGNHCSAEDGRFKKVPLNRITSNQPECQTQTEKHSIRPKRKVRKWPNEDHSFL